MVSSIQRGHDALHNSFWPLKLGRHLDSELRGGAGLNQPNCLDFGKEISGLEMKLRNQIVLGNLSIAVGLGFEAVLGASKPALLIGAVALYALANVIFWARAKKSRRGTRNRGHS